MRMLIAKSQRWIAAAGFMLLLPTAAHAAGSGVSLIDAVRAGDVTAVRALLRQDGVDVTTAEADGTTALHWAVHSDQDVLVDLLIESGASVQVANRYGMTPLELACVNGNARVIERLLLAGADGKGTFPTGETPLMTASRSDQADAVELLLANGADVNAREPESGQTALMWAAARGNLEVVKALLGAGADVDAKTPTVHRKHSNDELGFKATNATGQTGYVWVATDPSAFSPLMFAVRNGHVDIVRVLLDGGANVNDELSDGTSALILAVANAHFDLAAYLLERGADPNANARGWTALHQAVRGRRASTRWFTAPVPTGKMDSFEFIKTLIAHGAHVNARMWQNGIQSGERQRVNFMGATSFLVAAKIGDLSVMRLLLTHGADPFITNLDDQNALMVAAGVALFNPGEDAGSQPEDMPERLEAVKFLVELGFDVNTLSSENETALHGAVYLGYIPVVEYLVEQGAQLDIKNDRGWTPLMIANGAAWAEFYKEYPEVAVVLRRLMTERGLSAENQVGDQVTCKDCYLTRAEEAVRVMTREGELQTDEALVAALKNAR